MRWPSGDYREVAVLDIKDQDLSRCFGPDIHSGDEPGLGPWRAVGGKLSSGAVIELIEYLARSGKGFELRVDSSFDMGDTLRETLAAMNLGPESVLWTSPFVRAKKEADDASI